MDYRAMVFISCILTFTLPFQISVSAASQEQKFDFSLKSKFNFLEDNEKISVIVFFNKSDKSKISLSSAEFSPYENINAFSAQLTKNELLELAHNENVFKIFLDRPVYLLSDKNIHSALTTSIDVINATYVQNVLNITGRNVTVAVIDTGIDYRHPDLGNCTSPGIGCRVRGCFHSLNQGIDQNESDCLDANGHGTHVAGIIGANGAIRGIAPDVEFLAIKIMSGNVGYDSDVIAGIDWAISHGANIISMSLGGSEQPNDGNTPLDLASDFAVEKGIVVVAAAGNEGPGTSSISYPATAKKVIAVGASEDHSTVSIEDDSIASFSNRGPSAFGRFKPDLVAPGVNIYSTWRDNRYSTQIGTSMATPHVSGAAALLLEYNRTLTPSEIKSLLIHSASNIPGHPFEKGSGILNIAKAITYGVEVSINGNDRWEEEVIPDFTSISTLSIRNNHNFSIRVSIGIETPSDLEYNNYLNLSQFTFSNSILIPKFNTSNTTIKFSASANARPGIYGSTIIVNANSSETLRIPVSIAIPLLDGGIINGTLNNGGSCTGTDRCGDWIYYPIRHHNGTSLTARLEWENNQNDLDLFLFTSGGILIQASNTSSTNQETITLEKTIYDKYWLIVHGKSVNGNVPYNLTISYGSKLNLEPSQVQNTYLSYETANLTFNITNDAFPKYNLISDIVRLANISGFLINGNISSGNIDNSSCESNKSHMLSENGINTTNLAYLSGFLAWNNTLTNLDLYLVYSNNSANQTYQTKFMSIHYNSPLNISEESLKNIDILHYLKTYDDVGFMVCNEGPYVAYYNLSVNLTYLAHWNITQVYPAIFNISSNGSLSVNVSINIFNLNLNEIYDALLSIKNETDNFASVPIRIRVIEPRVVINEFLPNPLNDSSWIELYNYGETDVNMSNWIIGHISPEVNYTISNETIYMESWLLLNLTVINITLNSSGDTIKLFDPSGILRDNMTYYDGMVLGNFTYNSSISVSIGRQTDSSNNWTIFGNSTPGRTNSEISFSILLIGGLNLISLPLIV